MIRTCLTVATALLALGSANAQVLNQDHGHYSRADVERGQALYTVQCQVCHGVNGDNIPGIDLKFGKFRRVIVRRGHRAHRHERYPGRRHAAVRSSRPPELTAIVAFIRAGFDPGSAAVRVGNVERGRSLFDGKAQCATCHRVNGRGPRGSRRISRDIGSLRTLAALQRTMLDPHDSLQPIHRPVRVVTKSGETIHGRRVNEDTFTVQLIDDRERFALVGQERAHGIRHRDHGGHALLQRAPERGRDRGSDRLPDRR